MSYNKFRWWATGKRKKPLSDRAPLFDKIQNGDYDYSFMFGEADKMRATAKQAYQQTYDNYGGTDAKNRVESALEASRMKRLKAIKLELEAFADENRILWKLRKELTQEFGKDLWEKSLERQRGKGTLENLYYWYKKQVKEATTKSEMDIQLKRVNTRGLEYLL